MEREKFTPGPWWALFEGTLDIFVEPGISYKEVCNKAERSQAVANAYLISAAPEMYAKLAELEEVLRPIVPILALDISKVLRKARGEE